MSYNTVVCKTFFHNHTCCSYVLLNFVVAGCKRLAKKETFNTFFACQKLMFFYSTAFRTHKNIVNVMCVDKQKIKTGTIIPLQKRFSRNLQCIFKAERIK